MGEGEGHEAYLVREAWEGREARAGLVHLRVGRAVDMGRGSRQTMRE